MDKEPSCSTIEKSEEKTVENIVEELDKEEGVQSAPVSGSQSAVNQLHNDEKARRRDTKDTYTSETETLDEEEPQEDTSPHPKYRPNYQSTNRRVS